MGCCDTVNPPATKFVIPEKNKALSPPRKRGICADSQCKMMGTLVRACRTHVERDPVSAKKLLVYVYISVP